MNLFNVRNPLSKLSVLVLQLSLVNVQFIKAQSVEYDPTRNPFYNRTVVGFFTVTPPNIDATIDDYCWVRATAAPTAPDGGAGYNSTNFPSNQNISMPINASDVGTVFGAPPANSYTGSYPASAGSFGISWDLSYLYFAVKIVNQASADLTTATNDRGIDLYFNNGNGRSASIPINENYPRNYNNSRDMNIQLWYLPLPGNTDFPSVNASISGLSSYGNKLKEDEYNFAVKKTSDGYVYEGRIAWAAINREFINEVDGSYIDDTPGKNDSKWRPLVGRLLGIDIGASLLRTSGGPQFQMMWNQCCYNANWTQSQYFGYLELAGDTSKVVCPSSFDMTLTTPNITAPNQKVIVSATSVLPLEASRVIDWQLLGTNGTNALALVDNNTGVITPLNNGVLTIVGKSSVPKCALGTVSGTAIINIGEQVSPSDIVITGTDISGNWGVSYLVASAVPFNAPNAVTWSIEPASNLANINSITGVLKSTSLGNGQVTVKATSLANGIVGTKIVNISNQTLIDCFAINSYSNIVQCNRTINNITIAGFPIGAKISLIAQYYDPSNQSIITVPGIPDELMKYTIQQIVPVASIAQTSIWELTLNQQLGFFTITGIYLNDTTKKVNVKVILRGTTTFTGCPGNEFNIGIACENISTSNPFINFNSVLIAFDSTGGTKTLNVNSNIQWTAVNTVSWLNMSTTTGIGNTSVSITAEPSSNSDVRNANISFTGLGIQSVYPIVQNGLAPKISLIVDEVEFDFISGETGLAKQISLHANGSWSVQSNVPWITVSPSSGFGDDTITVTINNSAARFESIEDFERSGTITITEGTLVKTISVVQKGMAPLAISNEINNKKLTVYPNPSNGSVSVDNGGEVLFFQLINSIGTIVAEAKLNKGMTKFDFVLTKGIYLFKVGKSSQKLIIE